MKKYDDSSLFCSFKYDIFVKSLLKTDIEKSVPGYDIFAKSLSKKDV